MTQVTLTICQHSHNCIIMFCWLIGLNEDGTNSLSLYYIILVSIHRVKGFDTCHLFNTQCFLCLGVDHLTVFTYSVSLPPA